MTKKDYMIKVLDAVGPYRNLAPSIRILLEWNILDDATLDAILAIFRQAAQWATDAMQAQKLIKSTQIIEQLKKSELEQEKQDSADLAELENLFKQL
jgi:hypothetical protein